MSSSEHFKAEYSPVEYWAKIPAGITLNGDATSVAVDSKDNVYIFNRGSHPVLVFDSNGNLLRFFGQGEFVRPHGIAIDGEDNLYLVDDAGHFLQKRSNDGKVIWTAGEKGKPAPWHGGKPFNRPTDAVVHPSTGEVFVSDGYGNSSVHKFDPNGGYIKSWGMPGTEPGNFSLPHNIALLDEERLAVADRENFRIQIFDTEGQFIEQWHIHHPMSVTTGTGDYPFVYVGEMGPPTVQEGVPNLGNRVTVLDTSGKMLGAFGAPLPGNGHDQFVAPHGIAVDSKGNVYVAEVAWTYWWSRQPGGFLGEPTSIRKWAPK